jgi:arginine/ornithine transport system substrate-binding protein
MIEGRMVSRILGRVCLVLLLTASTAMAQDWKTLRVAIEGAYPPFSQSDGKKGWKGFDVDIANALCDRLDAKCIFVQRDWDKIQDSLLNNEVDAIVASMSITVPRKQRFDFTNRYYHTAARFVGPKDSEIEVTPEGLTGKRLGVQAKTVHEAFVRTKFGGLAEVITFSTQKAAVEALKQGQVDLFMGDAMALQSAFLTKNEGKAYGFLGPDFNDARWFGEGVGIAIRKEDQDLRYKLNRALDAIRADGTYIRLSDQYFGYDIYGAS